MNRLDEDHLGETWFHLMVVALLVFALLVMLGGCARGWGNGPSSDPSSLDAEQQRVKDAARKAEKDAAENLRRLNPMGGG